MEIDTNYLTPVQFIYLSQDKIKILPGMVEFAELVSRFRELNEKMLGMDMDEEDEFADSLALEMIEEYEKIIQLDPTNRLYPQARIEGFGFGQPEIGLRDIETLLNMREFGGYAWEVIKQEDAPFVNMMSENSLSFVPTEDPRYVAFRVDLFSESELYLARSDMHENMGNQEASLADIRKAAALGNETAIDILRDFKKSEENGLFSLNQRA